MNKPLLTLLLCSITTFATAQDRPARPAPPPTTANSDAVIRQAQQDRVFLCNQQATRNNLKGKEHRAGVSECLSGDSSIGASSRQPAPAASRR